MLRDTLERDLILHEKEVRRNGRSNVTLTFGRPLGLLSRLCVLFLDLQHIDIEYQ